MKVGSGGRGRLTLCVKDVTILMEWASRAVVISLSEQSEHGIHGSVMSIDIRIAGGDGLIDELCDTYLVDMGMETESALKVLHITATTGEDDAAKQLVDILGWNLMPHVLDNLIEACLDDVDELTAFD